MPTYYYPEGPMGPVCDIPGPDAEDPIAKLIDVGDGRVVTYGPIEFPDIDQIMGGPVNTILTRRCRTRELEDGTIEYYDCQDVLSNPDGGAPWPLGPGGYDWETKSNTPWGLDDDFDDLSITPESCLPHDPDINIVPQRFYLADGSFVLKKLIEKSTPVTFPVNSGSPSSSSAIDGAIFTTSGSSGEYAITYNGLGGSISDIDVSGNRQRLRFDDNPSDGFDENARFEIVSTTGSIQANFSQDATKLLITGSGAGQVTLRLEWDDNPNTSGVALQSIVVAGQTWTQSGEEGSQQYTISVTAGGDGYGAPGDSITLETNGSGSANIGLTFRWKDNPNTAGTALSSVSVGGITFNQTGSRGETSGTIGITAGNNYPLSIVGGTGYGGFQIQDGGKRVCFFDLDDNDCNVNFRIEGAAANEVVNNDPGYWSEEGNKYAVWVNPETCTLPTLEQQVTYLVDIPAADNYTIVGGADDNFNVFFNDESSPVIGGAGGIFAGGPLTTPYSATRALTAGQLKIVVSCTNSTAGFQDANGDPIGEAFSWDRNPGGWYLKLCRGNACTGGSAVTWVKSGPHPAWSDFMNEYAMFASNNETLSGVPQTQTWTVNIPEAGTYNLEVQADNQAVISIDGTSLGTVPSFTSSTNYTPTLSAGPHTITTVVTNSVPTGGADQWANNPAGVAWRLTTQSTALSVSFDSNGNIVTTGTGTASVQFDFEWDDNPNTYGQALGTARWEVGAGTLPLEFTQTQGVSSGSASQTVVLQGGQTYILQTFNNTGGFDIQNNGQKVCFKDFDGNDCNAQVTIGSSSGNGPSEIANSTIKTAAGPSNMIWNTRDDVLYEYGAIDNCIVQTAFSTYGTGFFGYLLYNDGTVQEGDFITQLLPQYKLETVFSGSGFQTNFTAVAATIFNVYLNQIGRFPEPAGFDGWIDYFRNNNLSNLTELSTAIYNSYVTVPPNGSGEQALQISRGGLAGNYDNCDTRRV